MADDKSQSTDPRSPPIPLAERSTGRYGSRRQTCERSRRFPLAIRLILCGAGGVLLAALAVARSVTPDPSGFGTHEQLGLPPCTFVARFGKPCPSCGMTTAWAHLTRGQIGEASAANLGGAVLGVTAVVAAPWLILSAASGHWLIVRPTEVKLVVFAAVVAAATFLGWWL